jgi:pimeloyl-ACP methyl ester carboxylesterase
MQKTISYQSSKINYYTFGSGGEVVFCFHGYGLDGSCFAFLENTILLKHTLFCIDFPFHGATEWNEGIEFTQSDLTNIISLLNPFPTKKFSILGYSMGGRTALNLLQINSDSIKKVLLIAPDGLKFHFWQYLSTQTNWGNKLFRFTMNNPAWLFALVKLGVVFRLLNRSITKFVHHHIDTKIERDLLYNRWTSMRKFTTNLALIKQIITEKNIQIDIVTGKYDRVITTSQAKRFKGNLPLISLTELDSGHHLLKEHWVDSIVKCL